MTKESEVLKIYNEAIREIKKLKREYNKVLEEFIRKLEEYKMEKFKRNIKL